MKKIKFLLSAAVIAFSMIACDTYEDVNENPNALAIEKVTPDLILPGVITQMYRTRAITELQLGSLWMNNWTGDTYLYGGPFPGELTLSSVNSQFYNEIWDNTFKMVYNLEIIQKYPNADHKQDNFVAVAKILKAYYMQRIVDLYGDIPYTEAWQASGNSTPKYDNDENVYKALIGELDTAMAMIANPDPNAAALGSANILWLQPTGTSSTNASMSDWSALANTIKLKYLIRMSNVTNGDLVTYRNQKLAEVAAKGTFISQDLFERPGYSQASNDAQNPLLGNYYVNAAGNLVANYSLITVTEHLANTLEGNTILNDANYSKFTGITDPRKNRMFTNVTGKKNGVTYQRLKGIRQGATAGSPGAEIDPNDPSARSTSKFAPTMFYGSFAQGASATVTGYANGRGGAMFTAAESNFLQAEAALRWPAIFSSVNAQSKFTTGVTSAFAFLGSPIGTYQTAISTRPGLGWTGTNAQKIEAIITQKWLALINVDALENFIEYNRTGYPYTPLSTTSVMPNKPYRLQYPQSELAANPNTPNVATGSLFTKNATTPFWNQN
ncbi:SusD/RagB family nutrient-binding outer membrane lipoprotein [uncultured Chryseobacterium sp.]|uniref:SusD/RagB family nutrient-binding outer membrane lipoprotein n=1 Tax=uncultured Chryseobacterium sp. TaxID=259322 RepID=UPI0025F1F7E0|nr:SusD/RagB family nutrient-binding outer membrane lipoprotein [uncultured Chryseobacterium sp.]